MELHYRGIGICTLRTSYNPVDCRRSECLALDERIATILLDGRGFNENRFVVDQVRPEERPTLPIGAEARAKITARLRVLIENGFCDN